MCWEESGGSWGRIYEEVVEQAEGYLKGKKEEEDERSADTDSLDGVKGETLNNSRHGKSMVKKIASRARNARKRLRRKRLVKPGIGDSELVIAGRPKRFLFRRRRG
mmetsp:Transcript_36231/g.87440  ORF Transcript_36231/g.87440 Transcript_36231/m.87440 type:complete len:106 (-) Transcript_36231:11-328(-)